MAKYCHECIHFREVLKCSCGECGTKEICKKNDNEEISFFSLVCEDYDPIENESEDNIK